MNRSTAAAEKWRGIIDEQNRSGQTVMEFCRQRGIAASSLFAWKRRLRGSASSVTPAFVEAAVNDEVDGEAIEIVCSGGRRIVVRGGFDSQVLRQVINVIEGLPSIEGLA